jgi:hypothetical protein
MTMFIRDELENAPVRAFQRWFIEEYCLHRVTP